MRGKNEELREEILEILWVAEEEGRTVGRDGLDNLLSRPYEDTDQALAELERDGMVSAGSNGSVKLTSRGDLRAQNVIRRHRLAERLLNDVLEMDPASIEGPACQFEHAITAEVEEKICTLLGHPGECPHGKSIPPGKCCSESQKLVSRAIVPLTEVECGNEVRVAYLSLSEEGRLSRLSSLGVLPGVTVKVEQRFPAFVIELEETSVAMEKEVAKNILVRTGRDTNPGGEGGSSDDSTILKKVKKKFSLKSR